MLIQKWLKETNFTVTSLTQTAATGAACPLSCLTNTRRLRSQMIHVRSRDPLMMTLYADDADRHVTGSVWPYNGCFSIRVFLSLPFPNSHTLTTVLVPAVITILELGQAAHRISPLSKFSNTATACKYQHHPLLLLYTFEMFRHLHFDSDFKFISGLPWHCREPKACQYHSLIVFCFLFFIIYLFFD